MIVPALPVAPRIAVRGCGRNRLQQVLALCDPQLQQLALPAQVHANGRFNERSHGTLFDLIIVSIIVRATI
jgi:hypothetical protein